MRFGEIGAFFRRLAGIKSELFVSLQDIRDHHHGGGDVKVGQGLNANVVMAPVQFIQRTFTQSVPVVEERIGPRKWGIVDGHPLEQLLAEPNPFYDGDTMMKGLLLSWFLDGNAYLLKLRNMLRGVVELWYVPHYLIEPKWTRGPGQPFIDHYSYDPDGGGKQVLAVEDVVHLRLGLDPRNLRLGLSPLRTVLREVLTDEEASAFSAYLLGNMGVPGGVISPKNVDVAMSAPEIEELKEYMSTGFTGKKRGKWLVLGAPTEVKQFGFDPNRLMLGPLRDISEERVCAVLGVPAAVVGFGAGLQQTKVGATMRELVKLARVSCIEPNQLTIGRQLGRQLVGEFEPVPGDFRVGFDNSAISMFREDEDAVAKRAGDLFKDGLAKRNEGRAMVGLDPDPDGDVFATAPPGGGASSGGDGDGDGDDGLVEPLAIDGPASRWQEWSDLIGQTAPNGDGDHDDD